MICNKCGKENNEGSKFCMWCGESLPVTEEVKEKTNLVNNPMEEEKTNNIEVNNNKQSKNKGKGLIVALIIVLLFIVGISGFLLGRYSIDKKDVSNNDVLEEKEDTSNNDVLEEKEDTSNNDVLEEENDLSNVSEEYVSKCPNPRTTLTTDIDETKYNNISEYIYEQDNVKINWNYCATPKEAEIGQYTKYELNAEEKTNVLEEMKNSMYSIRRSGIGGACMPYIEIIYERNNKVHYINYTRFYTQLYAMTSDDGNVYKIFDKTVDNTLEQPYSCLYVFDNLSSTANSLFTQLLGQ